MLRRRKILIVTLLAAAVVGAVTLLYARQQMRQPNIAPSLKPVTVQFPVDRTQLARPRGQYQFGSKSAVSMTFPDSADTIRTGFRGTMVVDSDTGGYSNVEAAIDLPTWKPPLKDRILHRAKPVGGDTVRFRGSMDADGLITWEGQDALTGFRVSWAEDLRLLFLAPLEQLEPGGYVTYPLSSALGKNMEGDIEYRVVGGELWKGKEGVRIEITLDGHCNDPERSITGQGTCHLAADSARILRAGLELNDSYQTRVTVGSQVTTIQMEATRTSWVELER